MAAIREEDNGLLAVAALCDKEDDARKDKALLAVATMCEEEDNALLAVAIMCEDKAGVVVWSEVKRYLSDSRSSTKLEERFTHLLASNAALRSPFSRAFFEDSCIDYRACVYQAIKEVLGGIRRSEVNQPSGKVNLNCSEIAPVGISQLVDAVDFSPTSIFVDIGSGTGNVAVQIALETRVRCYGVEIRSDLAHLSRRQVSDMAKKYSQLGQVTIVSDTIRNLDLKHFKLIQDCTVLYSSNLLFDPEDNLALQNDYVLTEASNSYNNQSILFSMWTDVPREFLSLMAKVVGTAR